MSYGESVAFDQSGETYDGTLNIHVLVRDTLSEPTSTIHSITDRILVLLDLKGTTLDDVTTVYWIQKLGTDFTHYEKIHFYENTITFRFVASK